MAFEPSEITTKQRILECAAGLFAEKGFTETTIRELAIAVGLKNPASLYFHFPSKYAILEHMLADYTEYNEGAHSEKNVMEILRDDPTITGILECHNTSFPPNREEYFLKVLCVVLQEQLRNPIVRSYMAEHIIQRAEHKAEAVIVALKELGILRQDVDPDYWMKSVSSLLYFFAARMMLGIGDSSPDFKGMGMSEMLRYTYALLLDLYTVAGTGDAGTGEAGD